MAEVSNTRVIGDFAIRPTGYEDGEQLRILKDYDPANGSPGHARLHEFPASFYVENLYILTAVGASSTGDSCKKTAPWPFTIWAADLGCEGAAGSTGTMDIRVNPVGSDPDASILDAAEDVKTGAGTCTRVAPEDGHEDVGYGDQYYIRGASGSAGSLTGGQAHLYCQRL